MAAGEEILKRIAAQDAAIAALTKKVDRLLVHLGADRPANAAGSGGAVATVAQIQGERGDFEVGRTPRNWDGPSFDGYRVSECPPDFLDFYADILDWKAANPRAGKEQYAKYDSLNAARCRRWAIEIREGRHKQQPRRIETPPPDGGTTWSRGGAPPPPPDDFPPPPPDDTYGDPPPDSIPF